MVFSLCPVSPFIGPKCRVVLSSPPNVERKRPQMRSLTIDRSKGKLWKVLAISEGKRHRKIVGGINSLKLLIFLMYIKDTNSLRNLILIFFFYKNGSRYGWQIYYFQIILLLVSILRKYFAKFFHFHFYYISAPVNLSFMAPRKELTVIYL